MATVPSRPPGRQGRDPSSGLSEPATASRVARAAWLFALWRVVLTLVAVLVRVTRPFLNVLRVPGRVTAEGKRPTIALDIARVVEARSYPRAPGERRKKRVTARFSRADIARIDALRRRLLPMRLTRAQMVRAVTFYVLSLADAPAVGGPS